MYLALILMIMWLLMGFVGLHQNVPQNIHSASVAFHLVIITLPVTIILFDLIIRFKILSKEWSKNYSKNVFWIRF